MISKAIGSKVILKSILGFACLAAIGCTGDGKGLSRQSDGHNKIEARTPASVVVSCSEFLRRFDKTATLEALDPAQLPAGLLLFTSADILLQSKSKPESILIAREASTNEGVKSQVTCSSFTAKDVVPLDLSIKGLTKIEIGPSLDAFLQQSRVTVRQFQMYTNARARGLVSLTPRLQTLPIKNLAAYLAQSGGKSRFFKLPDNRFILQTEREEGDARVELVITYEHVNRR